MAAFREHGAHAIGKAMRALANPATRTATDGARPPRGTTPWLLVAVLLAAGSGLAGCVSPPPRVDTAAEERVAHDPRALMHIADASAGAGDAAAAATFYHQAAVLAPDDPAPALGYARSLAAQNRLGDAATSLEEALPHMSGSGERQVRATLGRLLITAHRPTEAVSVLRAGLRRTPNDPSLLIGLGVALDASRDFPAAQSAYRQALAVEPNSIAAQNDLALSTALGGDVGSALTALQALRNRVVENGGQASDLATIDGNLALVHALRGELRQANEAASGATANPADLANNMRFYSALSPTGPDAAAPLN
ncbi:tetratricopeptide repeat protein [Rhizosaccharibacter radicis]|uniref:Tetratricopeptide repeat protein n=1 Tax=Rhizosaccharibacter radicis TaxID=2782605 RepID=A0ABT1VTF3_9PROT|nr:tetratricopeptide repeat protein [Acetobacteraceae bacterium KSS12]